MFETRHWLRRAHKRGLLSREAVARIKPVVDELGPKLNAYLRSIGERVATKDKGQPERATKDKGLMTKDKGQSTEK